MAAEEQHPDQPLIKQERGTSRRDVLRLASGSLVLIPVLQLAGCSEDKPQASATGPQVDTTTEAMATSGTEVANTPMGEVPETLPSYEPIPEEQTGAMPKLNPRDPAASALGYVENENDVEVAEFESFQNGQNCGNCAQFRGELGVDWGPCVIFPGKLVSIVGWCAGYIAQS